MLRCLWMNSAAAQAQAAVTVPQDKLCSARRWGRVSQDSLQLCHLADECVIGGQEVVRQPCRAAGAGGVMRMCHQALVFALPEGAPVRPREPASVEESATQPADGRAVPSGGGPASAPFSSTAVAADSAADDAPQHPVDVAAPVDAAEVLRIQHISAMDLYADRQPEELRWHDYSVPLPPPPPQERQHTHLRAQPINRRPPTVKSHRRREAFLFASRGWQWQLRCPTRRGRPRLAGGAVGVAGAAAAAGGVPGAGPALPRRLARVPPGGG